MSEYTPTTEQIRATYADGESEGTPEDYAEFDRWLADRHREPRLSRREVRRVHWRRLERRDRRSH